MSESIEVGDSSGPLEVGDLSGVAVGQISTLLKAARSYARLAESSVGTPPAWSGSFFKAAGEAATSDGPGGGGS